MKHIKAKLVALLVIFAVTISLTAVKTEAATEKVRGVWVSCFDYSNAGLVDKTEAEFRTNAKKMFANIKANGCNTVFFHVRAFDDAIYPSANFRWSKYITTRGALPYDPLAILVNESHNAGLKFHAWMNPYRVNYSKILDPGATESTNRILLAVNEIISRYSVDGIHFDDYFYPSGSDKEYKKYLVVPIAQKKANVNAMIRSVYQKVKGKSSKLSFGISPAGELSYARSIGCDADTWLSQKGYVDYVVPQIYWSNQYVLNGKTVPFFTKQVTAWRSLNKQSVPIYWGLALYRSSADCTPDVGWLKKSNNIALEIAELRSGGSAGYVLFSYTNFNSKSAAKEMANYRKQIATVKVTAKKSLKVKKKLQLKATIWPTTITSKPSWKSNNKKIATVSKTGVMKAKKKGTAKITATLFSKKTTISIKVK